ncbi:DNA primase [Chloroflexota bacterium]
MGVTDEIKQKLDIVDVIGAYTTLKKSGRTMRGLCPFHSENTPSFFVYPEQQTWHCFGSCNTGGDVFSFIMKKENVEFGEALRMLADRVGVVLPDFTKSEKTKEEQEVLFTILDTASQYYHNYLLNSSGAEKARQYVSRRGFSPQTVADFQLGYSPDNWSSLMDYLKTKGYSNEMMQDAGIILDPGSGKTHDRFRNRLMFPIRDIRGRTIGFGARAIDDNTQPKYLNSPQTKTYDKSSVLYGIDIAAPSIRSAGKVILVEGYIDVISAHQAGFNNVLGAMGTAITEKQIVEIKRRLSKNIVLAMDADSAGTEAMKKSAVYENLLGSEIGIAELPEGKDPDDVVRTNPEIWQQITDKPVPIVEYIIKLATSGVDLSVAAERDSVFAALAPTILGIASPLRQIHYKKEAALLLGINEDQMERALTSYRKQAASGYTVTEGNRQHKAASLTPKQRDTREEYCLALLLQKPELKSDTGRLSADYLTKSENREILSAWLEADDVADLKSRISPLIHDKIESLLNVKFVGSLDAKERLDDYVFELEKTYWHSVAAKQALQLKETDVDINDNTAPIDAAAKIRDAYKHHIRRDKHGSQKRR